MNFEFHMLLGASVLGILLISASSFAFKAQVGNSYTVGSQDEGLQPTGLAGRFQRAQSNFMETYPLFLDCIFLVYATQSADELSHWGSGIYLVGRTLYLPLYAVGVRWLRTFSWNIATFGLVLTGAAVLF